MTVTNSTGAEVDVPADLITVEVDGVLSWRTAAACRSRA